MHKILQFIKEFKIPKKESLREALNSLSKRNFQIFITSLMVAVIAVIVLLAKINNHFLVDVPADGGSITEGIIGMPTLVNPVLALSDADRDMVSLVYSGLMNKTPDGTFVGDLAQSYTVSPDGTTYTFILKNNLHFQDGTPLTADDVIFTINKIKDPLIKSPRKVQWEGVTINKSNDNTIIFTLKQPYASFMDNTTIGILPMHIWKNLSPAEFGLSGLNIKAIGSGPFQISSVIKNADGIPTEYNMNRFKDFALGTPHIKTLSIVSYANEKDLLSALSSHNIDQAGGISPLNADAVKKAGYKIHTATLPRMFGLFFNANENRIFADQAVVQAFNIAVNRNALVNEILYGYGTAIDDPVPESMLGGTSIASNNNLVSSQEEAGKILDEAGWKLGADGVRIKGGTTTITTTQKVGSGKKARTVKTTKVVNTGPGEKLEFSLATGDAEELKNASVFIKKELEMLGVKVNIKVYEAGQLNQLIRARKFETLFFGQVVSHEGDLFAFWHSSQRNDPGLNIAMYNNPVADILLDNAQKNLDPESRTKKYTQFANIFKKDLPAIFIYSPDYIYATSPTLNNLLFKTVTIPSDRFGAIYTWYADTDSVWKTFTN